ncbi:MAG: hypothetical protein NVSMB2_28830 [Chloroflexota bacterium]
MPFPTDEITSDPSLGLALARVAMGLDGLYRRTRPAGGESALAAEGLVPVNLWRGDPLPLSDWSHAREALETVQAQTATLADPVRRAFVEDTLVSLVTIVEWQRGDALPFRDRASRLLGLDILPLPAAQLADWRQNVTHVRAAEDTRTLTEPHIHAILNATLAEARERATQNIGPLPERPLMSVDLVHDVPYTAYCDYLSNTIRLNADQPFSAARLKLLILHEAYPGHDYHLAWRERDAHAGRQPVDSLLVITNTPSSPLFEGIGDNGAVFLDMLGAEEQDQFLLSKLRSAACVNACLMLHEQHRSPEEVRDFLIEEGLGEPRWAETRLRFMQDSLRAPFIFSYYLGYVSVAEAYAGWRGPRATFFTCLYGQMHSPRSLRLATERSSLESS